MTTGKVTSSREGNGGRCFYWLFHTFSPGLSVLAWLLSTYYKLEHLRRKNLSCERVSILINDR